MNIWVHSLTDGTTRAVTHGPGGDYQPDWSPDGRWVVFDRVAPEGGDIWLLEGLR